MNLHDPARPKVAGRPAFMHGYAALPRLTIWPTFEGGVEVSVMLRMNDDYVWKHATFLAASLPWLLSLYADNPERTLEELFGWTAEGATLLEDL